MSESRTEERRAPWWKGTRGEWYVVVQFILFILIAVGPRTLPYLPEWSPAAVTLGNILGVTLSLLGVALTSWGLMALGPNLTALPYPRDDTSLVTSGPYSIVRNPIYSGLIISSFGWGLWLHAWLTLLFAVGLFVLFDAKSRREERWLIQRFPEYLEYCAHVKKLIPWVY